eukprot:g35164.t1
MEGREDLSKTIGGVVLSNMELWAGNCPVLINLIPGKFSLDELLTNVMIYWVSGSITSSMRLYKENLGADFQNRVDAKVGVYVPAGMAAFPNELMHIPLVWARQKYKKIMTFSYMS